MKAKALIFVVALSSFAVTESGQQTPDISGRWKSNIGKVYEVEQTRNIFTWRVVGGSQTANGTINGLEVSASWVEGQTRGAATGVIVLDPQRRPVRVEWSNRVVFTRGGEPPPRSEERPPADSRPPAEQRPAEDRSGRERPPREGPIDVGGVWHGNNGLIYEFAQRGVSFDFRASDGSKGSGKLTGEMGIQASFPDRRAAKGRVFMGEEPGRAAAIEFDGGPILTRQPQPDRERPGREGERPPRPEDRDRPPAFDLSGRWFGSDRSEVEAGQEGPEFLWRDVRTGKAFHGRVEGERLWMAEEGRERRPVEGQVLEADGPWVTRIRWTDGREFTRGPGPSPETKAVQVEKIPQTSTEIAVVQAHLLKAKVYNTWVKMGGPLGGLGYDVRFAANTPAGNKTLYVTDNYSGVNKSDDGGATWSASNSGIAARSGTSADAVPVFSLTVDPNDPKIVWCGLKDVSGAYRSTDGGKTWVEVSPERAGNFVFRGFTIMQGNSNVVFAAGEVPMNVQGKVFDKTRGRVYKTEDGGSSWQVIWQGENLARYVIVHPQKTDIIYISTGIFDREANNSDCTKAVLDTNDLAGSYAFRGGVGIMKTEDGGLTWRVLGRGQGLTDLYVGTLVMHPTNPNILLAGCGNNSASFTMDNGKRVGLGGAFLSTNGGEEWTNTLKGETITAVDFAWSNPKIAYAGSQHRFYRSQDGGKTWTCVNGTTSTPWGPPGVVSGFPIDILVDPVNPNVLFVNNYGGGNVKSTDGGRNWTVASKGYTGALMFDVDIVPQNPETVYAGARSGAFRSLDGGKNWEGLSYKPAAFTECYSVAIHPADPRIILACREQLGTLYRSQDGGNSWAVVHQLTVTPGDPKKEFGFKRIVFAPKNAANPGQQVVYAGSCRPNNTLGVQGSSGLGIFRSTDGGLTWVEANNSVTKTLSIHNLAVHPSDPKTVYAATYTGGLCKTTDGGSNWVRLNGLKASDVRSVAIRPDKPDHIYAGLQGGGVNFSSNGGASWTAMASGMESNDDIYALVIDPARPEVVWAGSNKTGVYRYDTIEQQWAHFNKGLRTRAVTDLAISSSGKVLYATTWGEGVFRLDLKP
ncbi:MAG: hypothetical protein FJY83_07090 [Candidatus Aminicenantes bacterium]|nr:hypothetical protein [Candidatus Aminicenantes bacterium]